MAYSGHSLTGDSDLTSPKGGWTIAIRFWPAAAAAAMCVLALSVFVAFVAAPGGSSAPAGPPSQASSVAVQPDGQNAGTVASSVAQDPRTAASSWSMSPVQALPASAAAIAPATAALAEQAKAAYGVGIMLAGQDWGADAAQQSQNIAAVASAMELSPASVASSASTGPLSILSNSQGLTSGGWQPYGNGAHSFFTNSDQSAAGPVAANEIVLATGADRTTVMHELLHAYQFRNVAPGNYVPALLGDETRSFISATGWRQTVSDDQVRAAAHERWETIDTLYGYGGRDLAYTDANGKPAAIHPANPLEAFAMVGALYYARPEGTPLPNWPEYWQWFQANLGPSALAS